MHAPVTAQQQTNPHAENDKVHCSIQTQHAENLQGLQLLASTSDSNQP